MNPWIDRMLDLLLNIAAMTIALMLFVAVLALLAAARLIFSYN